MLGRLAGLAIFQVLSSLFQGWFAHRAGRKTEQAKAGAEAVKRARKRNEIDSKVSRLSDADLDDELYRNDD